MDLYSTLLWTHL